MFTCYVCIIHSSTMLMFFVSFLLLLQQSAVFAAPIDDYVWRPDPNYKWEYLGANTDIHGRSVKGDHTWTGYTLNVTSQAWLTDADFAPNSEMKSIWWHIMVVIVPDEIKILSPCLSSILS